MGHVRDGVSEAIRERESMKFFDSLVHATPDGTWLGGNRFDARMERLLSEMNRGNVSRACLVAIADHIENETVARFASQHPDRFVPVGSINPSLCSNAQQVIQQVARIKAQGFAGMKLHP